MAGTEGPLPFCRSSDLHKRECAEEGTRHRRVCRPSRPRLRSRKGFRDRREEAGNQRVEVKRHFTVKVGNLDYILSCNVFYSVDLLYQQPSQRPHRGEGEGDAGGREEEAAGGGREEAEGGGREEAEGGGREEAAGGGQEAEGGREEAEGCGRRQYGPGNHTSIYGSFYADGKWGFACCHQFVRNSYCTGAAGRQAGESMLTMPPPKQPVEDAADRGGEKETKVSVAEKCENHK